MQQTISLLKTQLLDRAERDARLPMSAFQKLEMSCEPPYEADRQSIQRKSLKQSNPDALRAAAPAPRPALAAKLPSKQPQKGPAGTAKAEALLKRPARPKPELHAAKPTMLATASKDMRVMCKWSADLTSRAL